MAPKLLLYDKYVGCYNNSITSLYSFLLTNQDFATFLKVHFFLNFQTQKKKTKECLKSMNSVQDISSYLILPIQRIPRYALLLDSLIKVTFRDHPDFEELSSAYLTMKNVAITINEQIRIAENYQKILEIQQLIYGVPNSLLLKKGRSLLRKGIYHTTKNETFTLFLFNDILQRRVTRRNTEEGPSYYRVARVRASGRAPSATKVLQFKKVPRLRSWLQLQDSNLGPGG